MGPHIEPPEELRSILNQLNAGFSVSPGHTPIQHLYATTVETDFSGCGTHGDFYEDCLGKAKHAITYSLGKKSEKDGMVPRRLKLKYSVGRLPSEPHEYKAAWITQVSPSEYDIMFNKKNEEMLEPYAKEKCTSVVSHEILHTLYEDESERKIEEMNLEALSAAGLHKEADLTKRGSNYVKKYHQKRA